jgi:hypothetical protein
MLEYLISYNIDLLSLIGKNVYQGYVWVSVSPLLFIYLSDFLDLIF